MGHVMIVGGGISGLAAAYRLEQLEPSLRITLVERLINRMMIPGHKGKKHKISSGQTTGKSVTLNNTGDAPITYEVRLSESSGLTLAGGAFTKTDTLSAGCGLTRAIRGRNPS